MNWPRLSRPVRPLQIAGLALVAVTMAACAAAAPYQPPDLGPIQQTMTAQGTRIAALEQQVSGLQTAVAQARITPTATPRPPTATPIPTVTGIQTDGATKGVATAKVTITEYSDYL